MSLPDTAMLPALAQTLGVTVTELLLGHEEPGEQMDRDTAEAAVQQAIRYPQEKAVRSWTHPRPWFPLYLGALVLGAAGLVAHPWMNLPLDLLPLPIGLAAGFGAYFCLFAPLRLPDYYDQYRVSGFMDGPVRMNFVGLSFNNRNWPHILRVCRRWCCAMVGLLSWMDLGVQLALPAFYPWGWSGIMMALFAAGLFLPVYWAGKRYEKE